MWRAKRTGQYTAVQDLDDLLSVVRPSAHELARLLLSDLSFEERRGELVHHMP